MLGGQDLSQKLDNRLRVGGRDTARVEDAQGTPTQRQTSPSILLYEDRMLVTGWARTASQRKVRVESWGFRKLTVYRGTSFIRKRPTP